MLVRCAQNINAPFPIDCLLPAAHYLDTCDVTTDRMEDVFIDPSLTPAEAKERAEKHGVAIVQDILTQQTAKQLREHILKSNRKVESTFVLNSERRFHIMPSHREPTVQVALKEMASHPVFRPLLDQVVGPSSSLVAMSAITNLHGAERQKFHADTATSHATHPTYFVPEYTLAIPLQDTTEEMGATGFCPGTHKCSDLRFDRAPFYDVFMKAQYPDEEDYEVALNNEEFVDWLGSNYPCKLVANVTAGSGMLYNADLLHRGGGHEAPISPERVVLFLTFAGSRRGRRDDRSLPLGTVHSLHWENWGHTIEDFETVETEPWRPWHIFGVLVPRKRDGARPWTVQDYFWMIFRDEGEAMHMISEEFNLAYVRDRMDTVIVYSAAIITIYYLFIPFAWMYAMTKGYDASDSAQGNKEKMD